MMSYIFTHATQFRWKVSHYNIWSSAKNSNIQEYSHRDRQTILSFDNKRIIISRPQTVTEISSVKNQFVCQLLIKFVQTPDNNLIVSPSTITPQHFCHSPPIISQQKISKSKNIFFKKWWKAALIADSCIKLISLIAECSTQWIFDRLCVNDLWLQFWVTKILCLKL